MEIIGCSPWRITWKESKNQTDKFKYSRLSAGSKYQEQNKVTFYVSGKMILNFFIKNREVNNLTLRLPGRDYKEPQTDCVQPHGRKSFFMSTSIKICAKIQNFRTTY